MSEEFGDDLFAKIENLVSLAAVHLMLSCGVRAAKSEKSCEHPEIVFPVPFLCIIIVE